MRRTELPHSLLTGRKQPLLLAYRNGQSYPDCHSDYRDIAAFEFNVPLVLYYFIKYAAFCMPEKREQFLDVMCEQSRKVMNVGASDTRHLEYAENRLAIIQYLCVIFLSHYNHERETEKKPGPWFEGYRFTEGALLGKPLSMQELHVELRGRHL